MNKLVVFDIDGVLANYEDRLVRVLMEEFDNAALENRDKFSLEERFAERPDILKRAQELTADPNFYYSLEPDHDALQFVEDLVEEGFPVIYLSSRPKYTENFTRRWLLKYVYGQVDVWCGVSDKAYFLSDLGASVEFVVEDNPSQISALKHRNFPVLVWAQKWNEGIFPRLYVRSNGDLMLWATEDVEAMPFWLVQGV